MATAKRKQEELGEECDEQEPHENECSDEEEAKRPRLELHHMHHQLPHRQWSLPPGELPARACPAAPEDAPCDLSAWPARRHHHDHQPHQPHQPRGDSDQVNSDSVSVDDDQPINFAYYHF